MRKRDRVAICVGGNALTVVVLIAVMMAVSGDVKEIWKFGPSDDLRLMTVAIDTWWKYGAIVGLVALVKVSEVLMNDFASPDLFFATFNPDQQKIYGFTRETLTILVNMQLFINNLGNIFKIIVLVTRLDIALISVVVEQLTTTVSVHFLLAKKEFIPDTDTAPAEKKEKTLEV